jgi:succinate dehydrogenase flavin-adding protein (antitoxin of CptAB toxin-antitoxin module)
MVEFIIRRMKEKRDSMKTRCVYRLRRGVLHHEIPDARFCETSSMATLKQKITSKFACG